MFSSMDAMPADGMSAEQFQRVAKALADPRRFGILERIAAAGPELACQRLCDCFPVSQATVSHHLKELTGAGLVESRREGQYVFYRARPEVLRAYLAELQRRVPLGAPEAVAG
jgi:ArsR family transcriptional regulator, arsenate/arsenite/antimonite-responsive transcriptional repressor